MGSTGSNIIALFIALAMFAGFISLAFDTAKNNGGPRNYSYSRE